MTQTETVPDVDPKFTRLLAAARAWRAHPDARSMEEVGRLTQRLREAIDALDEPLVVLKRKTPVRNRILWNERGEDIDEIVITDCTVHVEQMNDRCWWIGIDRNDGGYWAGNFHATSRGKMTFSEQEIDGLDWDDDDTHELKADS